MNVRDLERLLIERGAGAAKIDAVTRRLRAVGRLPRGGRGPNAPAISSKEAATILVALAGSQKGTEADARLDKLEVVRSQSRARFGTPVLDAVARVLDDPSSTPGLDQVRVGRMTQHVEFTYDDGRKEEFLPSRPRPRNERYYAEGIIPAALLRKISTELRQRHTAEREVQARDD